MYTREILEATRALLSAGGALKLEELYRKLAKICGTREEDFLYIIRGCSRFMLACGPEGAAAERLEDLTVVARTSLRLCSAYCREGCSGDETCQNLHLCRYFIYGNCRFGKGRRSCKFSHDVHSEHNYRLLRECTLHELHEDELFLLLLQNDPTLLPEVCSHYNRGQAPLGDCTFQVSCTKVHLCLHSIQGDCAFGPRCQRQHAIDQHGRRMLEERGLSAELIEELPFIYRNVHHLSAASAGDSDTPWVQTESCPTSTFPVDGDEICLHFLRRSCRFNNECRRVHFPLPYKWEVFDGVRWTELPAMEDIERDFCDPSKSHSWGDQPVDFMLMRRGSQPVRRLSTVSSVTRPPHYVLTTDWLWYYKGDQGAWIEYGQLDEKLRTTSVTSRTLEVSFQSDRNAEVPVVKGQRQYILSFKDMYQRNPKHNTKRKVRRRPCFVSMAEVQQRAAE